MTDAVTILASTAGTQGTNLAIVAAAITLALITLALTLPKVFNSMKTDGINTNVLKRVQDLETKSVAQDAKIHRYAVRVTRLTVLVLRMHALLLENKVNLPQDVVDEILELTKETEVDEP